MADETEHDELAGAAGSVRRTPLIDTGAAAPITACPATGSRPRDLEQFRAASAAACGDAVEEIHARTVRADMTIWFPEPAPGRWRPVKASRTEDTKTTIRFIAAPSDDARWLVAADRPTCRRITAREVPSAG